MAKEEITNSVEIVRENIKTLLENKGLTIENLSLGTGISIEILNDILSGDISITLDQLQQIAVFLEKNPAALLEQSTGKENTDLSSSLMTQLDHEIRELIAESINEILKKNLEANESGEQLVHEHPVIQKVNDVHTNKGRILEYNTSINDEKFLRKFCDKIKQVPDVTHIHIFLKPGVGLPKNSEISKRERKLLVRFIYHREIDKELFEYFGYVPKLIRSNVARQGDRPEGKTPPRPFYLNPKY